MKPCFKLTSLILLSFLILSDLRAQFSFSSSEVLTAVPLSIKREFRGVWIATVTNLDWPSTNGLSTAVQQAQLTSLLDNLKSAGFNAIIFQVRVECDAFYNSSIEPWSYWLTGQQGTAPNPLYDPLQFAVQEAHKRGMEIHAWFNPYRAVRPSSYLRAANHVSNLHPDWLLYFSAVSTKILDPGLPQVRDYVATVVSDIVRRYDVDGVHADDYFYPYPDGAFPGITHEDDSTFAHYNGGDTDVGHWRRENVNKLLKQIHDSVQAIKPWVKFGMSPFGIWRPNNPPGISGLDAYNTIYCDALTWLSRGLVDYLAPQLYWSFGGGQDYGRLQPWWADSANFYGRHLYTGNATYRIGTSFGGASELANQINLNRSNPKVQGSIQFRAQSIQNNVGGWTSLLQSSVFLYPSLIPVMTWKAPNAAPNAPQNLRVTPVPSSILYSLNWDPPAPASGDTAIRYLVYRYPSGTTLDTSNVKSIIAMEGGTSTVPSGRVDSLGVAQYSFAVSAVDRYNHEGPLSAGPVTIPTTVTAPTLAYPADQELHFPRGQGLRWARVPFASSYQVQVDTTPNFPASATFLTVSMADTNYAISGIKAQMTYYWRVAAGGQANSSGYTTSRSFTPGWPVPPTLVSPPLANNIPLTPTFTWTRGSGTSFEIKITDNTTRLAVIDTTVSDTTYTSSKTLDPSKIYTWTVAASNAYGMSDWPAESRFRTVPLTFVQHLGALPTTYELSQNYPNPFNPTTTIEFGVPQGGMVVLRVYDLLGREVETLVNEVIGAGRFSARFDAARVPSGTYFYVLSSSGTRMVKKMMVLK